MADFTLKIVTPEKVVYEGWVTSLVAPSTEGYLGVWAHHAPLLATLGEGTITVRAKDQTTSYRVNGGFLEVRDNQATVLVDELVAK